MLTAELPRPVRDTEDQSDVWDSIRVCWFKIEPLNGIEREQAEQAQSLVTHTASCSYFPGASSRMRLKRVDRVFQVQSVVNEREQNRRLVWRLVENA